MPVRLLPDADYGSCAAFARTHNSGSSRYIYIMCGILGQVSLKNTLHTNRDDFERALHLQAHRGPDDWGVAFGDRFAFGHRRLSIIDLSHRAKQPMTSKDGRITLIYNGEIYNYAELKPDLESKGYRFETTSDTEVLLNGLHHYGLDFVEKCIGMFV